MIYPPFYPRRAATGASATAGVAAQYTTISLYNDSTGADLIVVRQVVQGDVTSDPLKAFKQQGKFGTYVANGVPLVVGERTSIGAIYEYTTATAITVPDWFFNGTQGVSLSPFGMFPLAVLQPGWSLTIQNDTLAATLIISFLWEVIHPEDLQPLPPY